MEEHTDLSASLEDYLEAIYHIIGDKQVARAKDISKRLSVNNSSVTGALRSLADKKLINYAPYEVITLTQLGEKAAKEVAQRHEALMDFFVNILCLEKTSAEEAACKMEHAMSRPILDRLVQYAAFVKSCPRAGDDWVNKFKEFCFKNEAEMDCEHCISTFVGKPRD